VGKEPDRRGKADPAEREILRALKEVCEEIGEVSRPLGALRRLAKTKTTSETTSPSTSRPHRVRDRDHARNLEGKPDILIDDLLALELKHAARPRPSWTAAWPVHELLPGWVYWIVLIDSPASKVGRLERLFRQGTGADPCGGSRDSADCGFRLNAETRSGRRTASVFHRRRRANSRWNLPVADEKKGWCEEKTGCLRRQSIQHYDEHGKRAGWSGRDGCLRQQVGPTSFGSGVSRRPFRR